MMQIPPELLLLLFTATVFAVAFFWQRRLLSRTSRERDDAIMRAIRAEADISAMRNSQEAFRGVAASALESNARQFLDLAKSSLAVDAHAARADLEKRQMAIDGALAPVREALERYAVGAREMERERQRSAVAIEAELKRVAEAGARLTSETAALKNALKKPHVRGRWGEVQLRNCIELAGMSEHADVNFQDASRDDSGARFVPDMTVRMPGGRVVVVDAKTPLDGFLASLESVDDEARTAELIRHGRQVREHVKRLASRGYADLLDDSADFVILFLPNESFLYAALETQPDIMDYALEKKILIATPPTLIGLLKVIRFGWNEERLARNAEAISQAGAKLHKRLADFVSAFENVGKHLERARVEYEIGSKRLHGQVLSQARKMEALGAKSSKELPPPDAADMPDVESGIEFA